MHDIRYAADVVEVSVGDKHAADFVFSFFEVFGVWQNIINAWSLVVSKLETSIHDDDVVTDLNRGHVFANLFGTAKWDDTDVVPNFWQV